MAWTTPKDWTILEVVNAAKLNTHLRDNLKYLKGSLGTVTIDNAVTSTHLYVNASSPAARMHVKESADAFAAIIENAQNSGSPNGLLVACQYGNSAATIFDVSQGTVGGSLTNLFKVRGDGVTLSKGHPLFHSPSTAGGLGGSALTLNNTPTLIPSNSIVVTELGYYLVTGSFYFNCTPGGADTGYKAYGSLFVNGSTGSHTIPYLCTASGPDIFFGIGVWIVNVTTNPTTIELRGHKDGGTGNFSMTGYLTTEWRSA